MSNMLLYIVPNRQSYFYMHALGIVRAKIGINYKLLFFFQFESENVGKFLKDLYDSRS